MKYLTTIIAFASVIAATPAQTEGEQNGFKPDNLVKRAPLTVDGGWLSFTFGGEGTTVGPFDYTSASCTRVKVTDAYCYGDKFGVSDGGDSKGETSEPGSVACGGSGDAETAYADPDMSSGDFLFMPGSHSIMLDVLASPHGSGGAYIEVETSDECPISCEGHPHGHQECIDDDSFFVCSWGNPTVQPIAPGTKCCPFPPHWVVGVAKDDTCPF